MEQAFGVAPLAEGTRGELFFERPNLQANSIWSHGPIAQLAERAPDKGEVPGSNPGRPTSAARELISWGISSVGRAPALQAGGHRFEPGILHQVRRQLGHVELRIEPVVDGQRPHALGIDYWLNPLLADASRFFDN